MTRLTVRTPTLATATILAALGVSASTAHAQSKVFTDRTTFTAATSNTTNLDFEGIAPANYITYYKNGLTLSGTTFTATGSLFLIGPDFNTVDYGLGSGAFLDFQTGALNQLTVALPGGVSAFGFDFGALFGTSFTIALSTGETFPLVAPQAGPSNSFFTGPAFVGFTSATPITSLTITTNSGKGNNDGQIDNFTFGTAAPTVAAVPEPSEYAVGGMFGATLLFGMIKARRKKVAQTA